MVKLTYYIFVLLAIANSIVDAITSSKRTILILSPDFVSGDWPEFEVHCALRESLQKNHRVVPVVLTPLDDVIQKMSPTLQHIVSSFKCVHWPVVNEVTCSKSDQEKNVVLKQLKRIKEQVSEKTGNVVKSVKEKVEKKLGREVKDADPEEEFWRKLLMTLPPKQPEKVHVADGEGALKSLTSLSSSLASTTSENRDLIPTRNKKTNLIDRRHFKEEKEEEKTTQTTVDEIKHPAQKKVQIVRPLPRQESIESTDVTSFHSDVTTSRIDVTLGSSEIVTDVFERNENTSQKRIAVQSAC